MNLKCTKCGISKWKDDFYTRKNRKGEPHIIAQCKECIKKKTRDKCDPVKKKESDRKWRKENIERKKESDRKWREENKERKKENDRKWREENKEKIKQYKKDNYEEHKIKYRSSKRDWEKRKLSDPEFRLIKNLRSRLGKAVKNKQYHTIELIGCNPQFLRNWLEYQFNSKMSWDNYGIYWEVDHVIPIDYYKILNNNEQFECFNWKNLQPLESSINRSKSNKILPYTILMQELKVYQFKIK